MRDAQPLEITFFLKLFKEFAQSNFYFVDRPKSIDCLANLGITVPQAKNEIMSLTYEDYHRGPLPDKGTTGGELWEFGKRIEGKEIFIRLKVVLQYNMAKCQSFHVAEKPMQYPHKGGGK